jgi:hypothetical protein
MWDGATKKVADGRIMSCRPLSGALEVNLKTSDTTCTETRQRMLPAGISTFELPG